MHDSPDVIVFGEALVDFLPEETGPIRSVERFRKVCGGAPANVSIGLARLGGRPRFLTRLGHDEFGYFLRDALGREGVDVEKVRFTDEARTGIVFVCVAANGERSFMPYRSHSADLTIEKADFSQVSVNSRILHLGSNLMPYESGREATFDMLERAKETGTLVTFDANLRLHLWSDQDAAFGSVRRAYPLVDLVKLSDEELEVLGGDPNEPGAFYAEIARLGVRYCVITYGPKGARVLGPNGLDHWRDATRVTAVDTTGAGDAFMSALLFGLLENTEAGTAPMVDQLARLQRDDWSRILDLANFSGGAACTVLGATPGLPHADDIDWTKLGWAR